VPEKLEIYIYIYGAVLDTLYMESCCTMKIKLLCMYCMVLYRPSEVCCCITIFVALYRMKYSTTED